MEKKVACESLKHSTLRITRISEIKVMIEKLLLPKVDCGPFSKISIHHMATFKSPTASKLSKAASLNFPGKIQPKAHTHKHKRGPG